MAEPGSKRLGSARGRKQEEMEEDLQKLADGIIGEEYIQKETGTEDMASIVHLALTIDTTRQSIYELNEFLPNLKHLVLDNSNISSVRDLGIGLRSLTSLSLSCCGLNDIDGIGVLTGLQELCLSDNYITDVTPLAMHENLQSLNLSGNKIGDWSIADALSSSLQLRALFLARNPLCRARNYRLILASLVPGIEMLDGSPVDAAAAKRVTNGMILESAAELRMAEEDADDELRLESEIVGEPDHYPKPKVASNSFDGMPDTGSELTHGTGHVLAGNMAAAVRRRRQLLSSTDSLNSQDNAPGPTRQSREYESTLDILDAALLPCARTEPLIGAIVGPSTSNPFQKEGDVTSALMGNAAMYAQRADKQRDKDRERDNSGSSAGLRVERGDSGDSLSLRPSGSASPLVGARKERELRDSKDSKDSKERDGKDRDSKDRDSREREREHPSASLQSSHQFRPRSAATSSLKRLGSAGAMGTVPGSGSRDEDWVSRNSSFQSDSGSGGVGQSHSPRQRNASRPQSATSVLSDPQSPRHADAYAAPFKVVVQRDVDSPGRPSADVDEVGSPRRGSGKVAPSPGRAGWRDGREDRECLKDINPIKDGIASSIVHLDIVRRANSARDEEGEVVSDKDKGDDDSTDSSDTEDIAVTHAARHRLMSASASAAAANSATSTLKTRQHILQQLKNTSAPSSSTPSSAPSAALSALPDEESCAEEGIASVIGRQPGGMGSARFSGLDEGSPHRPPISRTLLKDTLSSQAGISLGFNLAGSLAAIDKWVQDMNSEDEEDSDPVGAGAVGAGDADGYTSRSDRDRDFEVSGASALEAGSKDSFSEASYQRSKSKILSRDHILAMCSNSGRQSRPLHESDSEDSDLEYEQARARGRAGPRAGRDREGEGRERLALPSKVSMQTSRDARGRGVASDEEEGQEDEVRPVRSRARVVPDFPVGFNVGKAGVPALFNMPGSVLAEAEASDKVSPPRFTAPSKQAEAEADMEADACVQVPVRVGEGKAVRMADADLIELLKRPPKTTMVLRTRSNFQEFFQGMPEKRIRLLLGHAYGGIEDAAERSSKINKRMDLLQGVLT